MDDTMPQTDHVLPRDILVARAHGGWEVVCCFTEGFKVSHDGIDNQLILRELFSSDTAGVRLDSVDAVYHIFD
jgi:hypothetical protein